MGLNSAYKKYHKPNMSGTKSEGGTAWAHSGYYNVTNKEKYIGSPNEVIYRSGWEMSFCQWCDASKSIIRWSAEPLSVKYYDKISGIAEAQKLGLNPNSPSAWTQRNYHIDFYVEVDKGDHVEKWFIEIKPKNKLIKPIPPRPDAPLKDHKKFVREAKEYIINEEKWKAMNEYATKVGASFYVFTEDHLQRLLGKFFMKPLK